MRYILLFLLLKSLSVYAIDIGALTYNLDANKEFTTKIVKNNTNKVKLYTVNTYEVTEPTKDEITINTSGHDLLFNPKRFTLQPGESKNVKFYYNGNKDKERYFRTVFDEYEIPSLSNNSLSAYLSVSLNAIMVVIPAKRQLKYNISYKDSIITNEGNSYFEFIIKESCNQPDSDSESKKLLPGRSFHSDKINKDNYFVIINDGDFNFINNHCKD
ncbi:fimbria/pilus periplasmic chaperone [Photobacterium damselae subsp. damselae]|uniref:Fimbria/pilus periplasmic chaperone n=1 Tax=Photobacterium damselae subsp. damselae TaxID=85581 RepID=A0A850R2Q9_PHODD|nr:fimbria/pilus periplasmic chaperone [Photobacterium damselae subsp. damselae]